jgi:hypothetical protein
LRAVSWGLIGCLSGLLKGGISVKFELFLWINITQPKIGFETVSTLYHELSVFLSSLGHLSNAKSAYVVLTTARHKYRIEVSEANGTTIPEGFLLLRIVLWIVNHIPYVFFRNLCLDPHFVALPHFLGLTALLGIDWILLNRILWHLEKSLLVQKALSNVILLLKLLLLLLLKMELEFPLKAIIILNALIHAVPVLYARLSLLNGGTLTRSS